MKTVSALQEEMVRLLPLMDSLLFNTDVFSSTGVYVVRKAIDRAKVDAWREEYQRQMALQIENNRHNSYHPLSSWI